MSLIFENVAALKAAKLPAGKVVPTKGYTTAGDGGGGDYLCKTAAQAAADGDTIDEVGAGFTAANGNVLILQQIISSQQFGAVKDGVTSDAAAETAFWEEVNRRNSVPTGYEFVPADTAGLLEGKFNLKIQNPYATIADDVHTCWIGYGGHESFPNVIGSVPGSGANYSGVMGYDNTTDALATVMWHFHGMISSTADHPTMVGGSFGQINGGSYTSLVGGTQNTISGGDYSGIFAGTNNAIASTGTASVITGGNGNNNAGPHCSLGGGLNNLIGATGDQSVVAGGGSNTATQAGTVVSGGRRNTASAAYANITGGLDNEATGSYSRAGGQEATTQYGVDSWASGGFSSVKGSAQAFDFVTRTITGDATEVDQYVDGAAVKLIIPENAVWTIKTQCLADDGTDTALFEYTALITRGAGSTTTSLIAGTATVVHATAGAATWSHRITTPSTGGINVKAKGEAAKTIRWVTRCQGVQLLR